MKTKKRTPRKKWTTSDILKSDELTSSAKVLALWIMSQDSRHVSTTHYTISEACGMSLRTVCRAILNCEQAGVFTHIVNKRGGPENTMSVFEVCKAKPRSKRKA